MNPPEKFIDRITTSFQKPNDQWISRLDYSVERRTTHSGAPWVHRPFTEAVRNDFNKALSTARPGLNRDERYLWHLRVLRMV